MDICLVTTGQPASNPRVVKEADALTGVGHSVSVIGAHWAAWADAADVRLMARRRWAWTRIEWDRRRAPGTYWRSRIRHRAAKTALGWPLVGSRCLPAAVGRLTPELTAAATAQRADLYIAHNLGALPAAVQAARVHGARVGFDAEDFHSGQFHGSDRSAARRATELAEATYLPQCDYVTAASPAIAEAYAGLSVHGPPICVLNVFPIALRPGRFRPTESSGPLKLYWFSQTIGEGRGLEDAVLAMARLPPGSIELHLQGTWQPGFEDRLRRTSTAAGVGSDAIVSHAPADPDDMVRMAAGFDVGLALEPGDTPNNDRALSNKVFTCLLAGAAIVGTRTRGQAPLLDELGKAAASYEARRLDLLAATLSTWIDDRDALDRARRVAWTLGEARYNWEHEQAVFLAVIRAMFEHDAVLDVRAAATPSRRDDRRLAVR